MPLHFLPALNKAIFFKVAFFLIVCLSLTACQVKHPPYAYITNQLSDNLSVIDTSSQQVIKTIDIGHRPVGVSLTALGNKVFISNSEGQDISILNTISMQVEAHIPVGGGPVGIASNSDGSLIYVADW